MDLNPTELDDGCMDCSCYYDETLRKCDAWPQFVIEGGIGVDDLMETCGIMAIKESGAMCGPPEVCMEPLTSLITSSMSFAEYGTASVEVAK
jgi:hypothetical protein